MKKVIYYLIVLLFCLAANRAYAKVDKTTWTYTRITGELTQDKINVQVNKLSEFIKSLDSTQFFELKIAYIPVKEFQLFVATASDKIITNKITSLELEGLKVDAFPKNFKNLSSNVRRVNIYFSRTTSLENLRVDNPLLINIEGDTMKVLPKYLENIADTLSLSIVFNNEANLDTEPALKKILDNKVYLKQLILLDKKNCKIKLGNSIYKFNKLEKIALKGHGFTDLRDDIYECFPNLNELWMIGKGFKKLPKSLIKYQHDIYVSLYEDLYEQSYKISEKYPFLHFDKTCE